MKRLLALVIILVFIPGLACAFLTGSEESTPTDENEQSAETPAETPMSGATLMPTMVEEEESPEPTKISGPVSGIAFVGRDRNLPGSGEEIFLINPDGSNPRNLTQNRGDDRHPAWSPNGTKLAFISERDENWEIYIMNADGTGQIRLTEDPEHDDSPSWSPDGQSLVFSSDRAGGSDLYILHLSDRELIRLTDHPAQEQYPDWSPDGSKILFSSFGGDRDAGIYTINVDGSNLNFLAAGPLHYPTWSPDGEKIAFDGEPHGCKFDIYIMNSDGSDMVQITDHPKGCGGYNKKPSWSPDGTQIVFHSSDRVPNEQRNELFIINTDGSGERQLTDSNSTSVYYGGFYPDWSPVE